MIAVVAMVVVATVIVVVVLVSALFPIGQCVSEHACSGCAGDGSSRVNTLALISVSIVRGGAVRRSKREGCDQQDGTFIFHGGIRT